MFYALIKLYNCIYIVFRDLPEQTKAAQRASASPECTAKNRLVAANPSQTLPISQCEKVISKFNGHPLTDPKNPTKPSGVS